MLRNKNNIIAAILIATLGIIIIHFYEGIKEHEKNNFNNLLAEDKINNFGQLGVNDFKKKLESGEYILIDVRTLEELLLYGKISDKEILIDINDNNFSAKIMRLGRLNKYLLYCWHGNRSQVVRDFMEKNGFQYVKDLKGGIDAWIKTGEEVIK